MNVLPESNGLLVLPRLRIQNANAISSPMTHGFPSMTAFLGLMWVLERKLAGRYPVGFDSVGVICHRFEEQVMDGGFVNTFRLTRNPLEKDGSTAAIAEEGRIHLDITLVIGVSGRVVDEDEDNRAKFAQFVWNTIARMRVAGGTVLPTLPGNRWSRPQLERIPDNFADASKQFRSLRRRWLPGFALVCRDDLLNQRLERLRVTNPSATLLDAWLDLSRFNWQPRHIEHCDENTGAVVSTNIKWRHDRTEGWIVPIPIGYGALSELHPSGTVVNARDFHTPFRFVESLYSIGQWIGPHRLNSWRELLWYSYTDTDDGLYRACNDYVTSQH